MTFSTQTEKKSVPRKRNISKFSAPHFALLLFEVQEQIGFFFLQRISNRFFCVLSVNLITSM
jgi:hypothetical protein